MLRRMAENRRHEVLFLSDFAKHTFGACASNRRQLIKPTYIYGGDKNWHGV